MNGFDGQVAIVTGAASGIGRATAECLLEGGARVMFVDRDGPRLQAVVDSLAPAGHCALLVGDLNEAATSEQAVARALDWGGRLDVVVSCAAAYRGASLLAADAEAWRRDFDAVLLSAHSLVRAAARAMIERGIAGRIVHVTSIHGTQAEVGSSAYGAAKAALNQLARCQAVELAPYGIRVNAVAPGFVDTPMAVVDGVNELETERFRSQYVEQRRIPLARAAQPREIAAAILFLAGEASSYITGHVLTVDGGLTITF